MAATIRDVAARIGVSPSTVSRVLNDTGLISEETKQQVYKAIQELDYHPNMLAQSFAKGKAGSIALVMDARAASDFSNIFFYQSVFAVETIIQEFGYHLIIASDRRLGSNQSPILEMVLGCRVDGLILPPTTANPELLKKLEQSRLPFVVLGQPITNHTKYSWVDVDNTLGAQMAVEHLYMQSYERIAYVTDNVKPVFEKKRLSGYMDAIKNRKNHSEQCLVNYTKNESEYIPHFRSLLNGEGAPDAFICSNNIIAFYTLRALRHCNKQVPRNAGVITFDNYPLAEYTDPPLTSINIDTFQMGRAAAELLMHGIQKHSTECEKVLVPTSINIRESTRRKG